MYAASRSLRTIALMLLATVTIATSGHAQTNHLVAPSRWQGVAEGSVGGVRFRLPVTIELKPMLPGERNPFGLLVGVGNVATVGSCSLFSAMGTYTPYTGRPLTLQYLAIRASKSGFNAALVNTQHDLASVANYFTGPNVAGVSSPLQAVRDMYVQMMGNRQDFYFQNGTTVAAHLVGGRLVGRITGIGAGLISTGMEPNLRYDAAFTLARIR